MKNQTYTSATTFPNESMDLDKLITSIDKAVEAASVANEWMLIGPGGKVWKTSKTMELIHVLSPYAMKEMFP